MSPILIFSILFLFVFATLFMNSEYFEVDRRRIVVKKAIDINNLGYDDVFNDVIYYPNKGIPVPEGWPSLMINKKTIDKITDDSIDENKNKTTENPSKTNNNYYDNQVKPSEEILNSNNPLLRNSLYTETKERKIIGYLESSGQPIYDDINPYKEQFKLITFDGVLNSEEVIGINDCINSCNGNCVEHGISGNAYCFKNIKKSDIVNLDRLIKK